MIAHVSRNYGLALVALAIMAVAQMDATAADKKAKAVEDWEIRGEKGGVMTRTPYALLNLTSGKYLHWNSDARKLVWEDHKPRTHPIPHFEFVELNAKKPAPLKFGDTVAIAMPGSATSKVNLYLVYKEQESGINLTFETWTGEHWEIRGGPIGTPVPTNAKISLYNKAAKDSLIYAEREHGINLRWNGDVNKPRDHRKK
jgi:hypothetical protein